MSRVGDGGILSTDERAAGRCVGLGTAAGRMTF